MESNATAPLIFVSYAPEDAAEKDQLMDHLRVLELAGKARLWVDDRIRPGADWQAETLAALSQASIVMMLVTIKYLTSEFVLGSTVPVMLERRSEAGVIVMPIIAKSCPWPSVPWLSRMSVRPKMRVPVWGRPSMVDAYLSTIVREIDGLLDTLGEPPHSGWPAAHQLAKASLKRQIADLKRRLNVLLERQAKQGDSLPVGDVLDIEDIQNQIEQLQHELQEE